MELIEKKLGKGRADECINLLQNAMSAMCGDLIPAIIRGAFLVGKEQIKTNIETVLVATVKEVLQDPGFPSKSPSRYCEWTATISF